MKISVALLAILAALGSTSPIEQRMCGGQEALCASEEFPPCCLGYRCIRVSSYFVIVLRAIAGVMLI